MLDENPPPIKTATADPLPGVLPVDLRDYFAGQALIGILGSRHGFLVDVGTDNAPSWAYRVADAMLAERAKALTPGDLDIPTVGEMFPREVANG
jgi:hypothetical protein